MNGTQYIWLMAGGGALTAFIIALAKWNADVAELIAGMFNGSRYKRSQGRIARQATFFAMLAAVAIGAWRLSGAANADSEWAKYGVPATLVAVGAWVAFRIVNIPSFADFLISVEAEMNKVSWPSRPELFRASMVVMVVIFMLTAILFTYDFVLKFLISRVLGLGAD
jgi:preprotein translocase subunit SecE